VTGRSSTFASGYVTGPSGASTADDRDFFAVLHPSTTSAGGFSVRRVA
jgi:hypothetical protein